MKREYQNNIFQTFIQQNKSFLFSIFLSILATVLFSSIIIFGSVEKIEGYNFKWISSTILFLILSSLVLSAFLHKFSIKTGLKFIVINMAYLGLISLFFSRISYTSLSFLQIKIPLYIVAMGVLILSYFTLTFQSLSLKKISKPTIFITSFLAILSTFSLFQIIRALPAGETFNIQNPVLQLVLFKVNPFFWIILTATFLSAIKTSFTQKNVLQKFLFNVLINLQIILSIYILTITKFGANFVHYWISSLLTFLIWHGFYIIEEKPLDNFLLKSVGKNIFFYHLFLIVIVLICSIFFL